MFLLLDLVFGCFVIVALLDCSLILDLDIIGIVGHILLKILLSAQKVFVKMSEPVL